MKHYKQGLGLGLRWVQCGWRLFQRNPWLLGGMGITAALIFGVLRLLPAFDDLLIALLAPICYASAVLAIDGVAKQKMTLPARLRSAAIKQSPRELFSVFGAERRMVPMALASLAAVAIALVVNIIIEISVGAAWSKPWVSLSISALIPVLLVGLGVVLAYATLAATLIYALPLAFLQGEALFPTLERSLRMSRDQVAPLAVVLAIALSPSILATVTSWVSFWIGAVVWVLCAAIALPLAITSLYCGYRTLFTLKEAPPESPPAAVARKPLSPTSK